MLVELLAVPGLARPVYAVLGKLFCKSFPPHCHIVGVKRNVCEYRAALCRLKRVVIGVFVRAGSNAEEAVFGVDSPKSSVLAHSYPGDIVADAFYFEALVNVVFGRYKHCKVGFAARRRESRRNVLLFAVGIGYAEYKHMLCHPALVLSEIGSDTECKTFFTEQNVSAVSRVYGNYRVLFGEVHNIAFVRVDVALSVEALNKIAVLAYCVKHLLADARHNYHVKNNVNRVGNFDAVLCERRADNAHRIRNDVHRSALHTAARDFVRQLACLSGVHPVVYGTGVFLCRSADESSVFHAGNVVHLRAVKIAVG